MNKIIKLRKKIDVIDNDLLKLINKRSSLAMQIGKAKKEYEKRPNFFRPERQINIVKRLISYKMNKLEPQFIFNLWKNIFFFQTKIQGKIKYVLLNGSEKDKINKISDYFGGPLDFIFKKNIRMAINYVFKDKNTLLFLDYPGEKEHSRWWTDEKLLPLYVIATIPLILKKNQKPEIVILSKNTPVYDKNNISLYSAKEKINIKNLKLISSIRNQYLYLSPKPIKDKKLKFLGSYVNLIK